MISLKTLAEFWDDKKTAVNGFVFFNDDLPLLQLHLFANKMYTVFWRSQNALIEHSSELARLISREYKPKPN